MLETFTFTRDTDTGAVAISGNIPTQTALHRLVDITIAVEANRIRQEVKNDKLESPIDKGNQPPSKDGEGDITTNPAE
jgi:hypothetical protein